MLEFLVGGGEGDKKAVSVAYKFTRGMSGDGLVKAVW